MIARSLALFALPLVIATAACGGGGRTPDVYQSDVSKLVATSNEKVQACYRTALEENPSIAGDLTVLFWAGGRDAKLRTEVDRDIEMKFGQLGVIKNKTTVPMSLGDCVTKVLNKLELTPTDPKRAEVTWTWHFRPNQGGVSAPTQAPATPTSAAPAAASTTSP